MTATQDLLAGFEPDGKPAASGPDDTRVAASLDNWKRKLLDISKRNRALNFRPTKATTLLIVDEQPAEVFRALCTEGRSMRFQAAPERGMPPSEKTAFPPAEVAQPSFPEEAQPEGVKPEEVQSEEVPLERVQPDEPRSLSEELTELPESSRYVPYAAESLDARQRDDLLQTSATPDMLDRTLRRIEEQARESLEEQGVNTLFLALGMLHYREADASDGELRAPLVLVPVELSRKNARAAYTLRATEDDPLVNPALAEYLRRAHGLALPELPEPMAPGVNGGSSAASGAAAADDYDLQTLFCAVGEVIQEQRGWEVRNEIALSFFSFQKLVMYKDLEANVDSFAGHPLIRQVVLRSGSSIRALPDEIREAELDAVLPPEGSPLVTNADGSQLRAILAVGRGHSLVLEGPPGTGKSQTITNLIAQALGQGKSVLFVAEKMAALEVVHQRLQAAGLGEFSLELHSTKANKRSVMREIAATLDLSLQRPAPAASSGERLQRVRSELTGYTQSVHAPVGRLGWSPYRAFGELELVRDAPRYRLSGAIDEISADGLLDCERALDDLTSAAEPVGSVTEHPWRGTQRTFYSEDDLEAAADQLDSLRQRLGRVRELAAQVEAELGLPAVRTLSDAFTAGALATVLGRSPGAPLAVLQSAGWNSPPGDALDLVRVGRELQANLQALNAILQPEIFQQRHADDVAYIEERENSPFRLLNGLDGRHRAIKRRWTGYRLPGYQPNLLEQATQLRRADTVTAAREELRSRETSARGLFGELWRGEHSDWDALESYVGWVVEFRKLCLAHGLQERALQQASNAHPDISTAEALQREAGLVSDELAAYRNRVEWADDSLQTQPLPDLAGRLEAMREGLRLAPRWGAFAAAYARAGATPAGELAVTAARGEVPFGDLRRVFRRAFLQRWLTEVVQREEPLRAFHGVTHEQRIGEFRQLDEQTLLDNRVALVRQLRDQVQARLRTPEAVESLPFLRRQLSLQRNLSPLRVTMQRAGAAIRAIKPVFMMSPLSVAQLLDRNCPQFDLVIFDEASQLPTEDAIGAIGRGNQLVVVGDPKQLPPTNFFSVMNGSVLAPIGEDGLPLFEDTESILEEFGGSGAPSTRLRWHYRSLHEALIHFSNVRFYESDLYTFPSVQTDSQTSGVSFEWVPEGVYEGKGLNLAEARRVVEAVIRHARTRPEVSLAVGTFNLRQQLAIQDLLEEKRREDPSLEPFFARGKREPFFVKNLENIQGDERDVIFLSVTYGKDANGVLRYNFGPLNGDNGWRRLNVLTTRARKQMRVFSSIRGEDINPIQATSQGPQLLREFLTFAERGRVESAVVSTAAETESPFEREVYLELTRRGLTMQPQVGVAGYRIDFGVLDSEVPGRFLCGIECDGQAYHSSETARDRDRLRQQVLEARGWTIFRVWSTDWFKDREGQIDRLLARVEEARESCRRAASDAEEEATLAAAEEVAEAAQWTPIPSAPALEPSPSASTEETASVSAAGEETTPGTVAPLDDEAGAVPYQFASSEPVHVGQEFMAAATGDLWQAIAEVMSVEAPLHLIDLAARVTARWGADRVSPRMARRVRQVVEAAAQHGIIRVEGEFVYRITGGLTHPRSRAGTGISGDRIPPEEYRLAVLLALRGGALDRKHLVNQVRALFGFSRTGANLDHAIGEVIDQLLEEQVLGEGSAGLSLRG